MSCADRREGVLRLGSSRLAIAYPADFEPWFSSALALREPGIVPDASLRLESGASADLFNVVAGEKENAGVALSAADALAVFWERAAYLLVDRNRDALCLHAATLVRDDFALVVPGQTGAGKTRLSLWSRLHGFDVLSDEVVALARPDPISPPGIAGVLARPIILKDATGSLGLLREGEEPLIEWPSGYGHLLRLPRLSLTTNLEPKSGLVIYPRYVKGATLTLTLLSPGEAASRLIESCINVRNLPRGGLSLAGAVARAWPAIAIDYGASEQIEGRLDVLCDMIVRHSLSRDDLAALCKGFSMPEGGVWTDRNAPAAPAVVSTAPLETQARFPRRLTVGMATYDDYDGVYFTVQSLRLNNPELAGAVEFVVIDNNPEGVCAKALSDLAGWIDGYRYVPRGHTRGTAIRNAVFEEASSPIVLCMDSHVLTVPGAVSAMLTYFDTNPTSRDLVQGPMIYDDLSRLSTHWEPTWRGGMFGTWAMDPRGEDRTGEPFDIPLQGLGLFACRRDAWPGFNPLFRGFGGEEGYIHEKFRQRGGRTLCLPALRWLHRFGRPMGVPYSNRWEDRIRNYVIGMSELALDLQPLEDHFTELLGSDAATRIFGDIRREFGGA